MVAPLALFSFLRIRSALVGRSAPCFDAGGVVTDIGGIAAEEALEEWRRCLEVAAASRVDVLISDELSLCDWIWTGSGLLFAMFILRQLRPRQF
jgi:hypothetical protein